MGGNLCGRVLFCFSRFLGLGQGNVSQAPSMSLTQAGSARIKDFTVALFSCAE